jgi:hypothetical protein
MMTGTATTAERFQDPGMTKVVRQQARSNENVVDNSNTSHYRRSWKLFSVTEQNGYAIDKMTNGGGAILSIHVLL